MKRNLLLPAILAVMLVLGLSFFSCDSSGSNLETGGNERQSGTYQAVRGADTFTLTISAPGSNRAIHLEGDIYELIVKRGDSEDTSSGTAEQITGNAIVLQPSFENAAPFTVALNSSNASINSITGTITLDCGRTVPGFAAAGGGGGGGGSRGGGTSGGGATPLSTT